MGERKPELEASASALFFTMDHLLTAMHLTAICVLLLLVSAATPFLAENAALEEPLRAAYPREAWPTESGYLTINKSSGARMFYAFYEAISPLHPLSETPLLLWLQGGPGCSSMIGNFYELGPWRVGEDMRLHKNTAPWNRIFGVLFLDNPVGTGFSIAPSVHDIPSDENHVARDVYTALQSFFNLHHSFRSRPFYVTGESYAGKYAPAVGVYILEQQDRDGLRLDGVAIGNGLTHPEAQVLVHAPMAYYMGLIDELQRRAVEERAIRVASLISRKRWAAAHTHRNELLSYLSNITGLATLYDVRRTTKYYTTDDGVDILSEFLNKQEVKEVLKVEVDKWEACSDAVSQKMANDTMKSTKHLVEKLLLRVPVLLYQGAMDLRDGVASTEAWIRLIEWSGMDAFAQMERKVWMVDQTLAGYVRSYRTLTHVVITNAGHLVPTDQNYHSQLMIEHWVSRNSFV